MMITTVSGPCQFEGCDRPATTIACGRELWEPATGHPEPAVYCDEHASLVTDERNPEYVDTCPNCGCRFGVN